MSSCSRISAQALLQSVQEMVQSLSELHDLRRRVREAEASFAKAKRLRHDGLLPDGVEKHFEVNRPAPLTPPSPPPPGGANMTVVLQ